ncbi:conserved hypothetical protein [Cytophaga hutchinsonii ATCC 33406]|uniref:Transporter n=3 Tax=Cytophaga hutchinsonii TaxID=985 RepID=A0A6N4SNF0_CYTH3|nr:conserved hypothetical protein [Cytophaga hutchinsonii ATCC 33406]
MYSLSISISIQMNMITKCCLLLLFAGVNTIRVSAQSDSSITTPACLSCLCSKDATPAGVMISHVHPKGEWMLSYRYMGMRGKGIEQNGRPVTNDQVYDQDYLMSSDNMHMDMHMLMAMYGLTKNLTLMGMVEYNRSTMNMQAPEGSAHVHNGVPMSSGMAHDMKASGLGDVSVTALYALVNSFNHHLLVSGGITIPTGSIQTKGGAASMYPEQRYPYMMQQGSGTWDVLPGLTYTFQHNKIMASSQLCAAIRTGYNTVGYKLGNKYSFNNWVGYRWLDWFSTSLRAEANTTGSISGSDPTLYAYNEPSANPYNYGGQTITGYAGVNFYFLGKNKIGIEGGLPLYQKANGIQTAASSTIHLNYTLVF